MKDIKESKAILENALGKARKYLESEDEKNRFLNGFSKNQKKYIETIISNVETQKSVLAVLITSFLKKIEDPSQDVRLHREEFKNGYSGRSLDTNFVTPWLKDNFRRFAPKESGWLTRSIEQPRPFNKKFPGKIRNKEVKNAFLSILHDIEEKNANAKNYLIGILILLLEKIDKQLKKSENLPKLESKNRITINLILKIIEEHFSMPRSSRLPVIAIYSIYKILSKKIEIYKDKKLQPLKSHTTSDKYTGYGDIEVHYGDDTPFEIVEIKHKIPIDLTITKDVLEKIKDTSIKRYFILTTAEPNFKGDEEDIHSFLADVKGKYDIDIIKWYNSIFEILFTFCRRFE